MKTFGEALNDTDCGWKADEHGYVIPLAAPNDSAYEIRLEPLLFGQWYVAVYKDEMPVANKVPVRPGGYLEDAS